MHQFYPWQKLILIRKVDFQVEQSCWWKIFERLKEVLLFQLFLKELWCWLLITKTSSWNKFFSWVINWKQWSWMVVYYCRGNMVHIRVKDRCMVIIHNQDLQLGIKFHRCVKAGKLGRERKCIGKRWAKDHAVQEKKMSTWPNKYHLFYLHLLRVLWVLVVHGAHKTRSTACSYSICPNEIDSSSCIFMT